MLLGLSRQVVFYLTGLAVLSIAVALVIVFRNPTGAAFVSLLNPAKTVELKPTDMFRAARLTADERERAVADCTARASKWMALSNASSKYSSAERRCDCFVNQVEDRGSKLQFAVAMDALANFSWDHSARAIERSTKYRAVALKSGMSEIEYQRALTDTVSIVTTSAQTCMRHLTGN